MSKLILKQNENNVNELMVKNVVFCKFFNKKLKLS